MCWPLVSLQGGKGLSMDFPMLPWLAAVLGHVGKMLGHMVSRQHTCRNTAPHARACEHTSERMCTPGTPPPFPRLGVGEQVVFPRLQCLAPARREPCERDSGAGHPSRDERSHIAALPMHRGAGQVPDPDTCLRIFGVAMSAGPSTWETGTWPLQAGKDFLFKHQLLALEARACAYGLVILCSFLLSTLDSLEIKRLWTFILYRMGFVVHQSECVFCCRCCWQALAWVPNRTCLQNGRHSVSLALQNL